MVEFALMAPVFFLFLFASFEFGRLNVIRHTADHAAYEAARTAMVPGATANDAKSMATNLLKAVGARAATITVTPSVLGVDSDEVTVQIQIPMNKNGLIVPHFTSATTITATSTLRTERLDN